MNSDDTTALSSGRLPKFSAAGGALGVGFLAGGTALAAYSRFVASMVPLGDEYVSGKDIFGSFTLPIAGVPDRFATTAVILGCIMLIVTIGVIVGRMRGRQTSGRAGILVLAVLATVVTSAVMSAKGHLPGMHERIRFEYPLFSRLPTALVAGGLVLVGAVLVLGIALRPEDVRSLGRRALAAITSLGLLVSAGLAMAAIHAGDDKVNVDHLTAAAVQVPAIPDRLGTELYRVPIPIARYGDRRYAGDVVVAGAGFVVASAEGLTGYDGTTGKARWNYLRRNVQQDGRLGVEYLRESLLSVDGGTVVLARWDHVGWTAFDALTGAVLWTDSEFSRAASSDSRPLVGDFRPRSTPQLLTVIDGTRFTRYDARTGSRMWSVDDCNSQYSNVTVTDTAIYRVTTCSDGKDTRAVATALDLRTGAIIANRELVRVSGMRDPELYLRRLSNTVIISWSSRDSRDDYGQIVVDRPDHLATVPVAKTTVAGLVAADPNSSDALTTRHTDPYEPDAFQVVTTDSGAVRYPVSGIHGETASTYNSALFVATELVEAAHYETADNHYAAEVRSWNRNDGTAVTTRVLDGEDDSSVMVPLTAPGALIVLRYIQDKAEVIGFGTMP